MSHLRGVWGRTGVFCDKSPSLLSRLSVKWWRRLANSSPIHNFYKQKQYSNLYVFVYLRIRPESFVIIIYYLLFLLFKIFLLRWNSCLVGSLKKLILLVKNVYLISKTISPHFSLNTKSQQKHVCFFFHRWRSSHPTSTTRIYIYWVG